MVPAGKVLTAAVAAASLAASVATAVDPLAEPSLRPPGAVEGAAAGPAWGTYAWPVPGPVLRPFDAPASAYGPGHRGIDIGAEPGTPVRAAEGGVVTFAGRVAGGLYVSVDHPDGVRTTYSWLSVVRVRRGDAVRRGGRLGSTGWGHPGSGDPAHLHFGARVGAVYVDPMLLLERGSVVGLVRLAPLEGRGGGGRPRGEPVPAGLVGAGPAPSNDGR